MTILPDSMIVSLCRDEQLITPFNPRAVQPASYDLSLGWEFIVFDAHEQVCIDLEYMNDESAKKVRRDESDNAFILHPGEFVLGVTEEHVNIPENIVGRLEGKSSIGRLGVLIHVTAGFIDPGFRGPVTLEIYNVRKIPIVLRCGQPFCQMSFSYMHGPAEIPYQGRYQDAEGVEASKYEWEPGLTTQVSEEFEVDQDHGPIRRREI